MTITVWSGFSKRRNSTKQPSATGTIITANLKENCSIESPVFILQGNQFNIDYVQAFGAYFYVSNIISLANNLTELHCEKDVLATYKSEIGSTSAYILYTTNGNNKIIDPRLQPGSNIGFAAATHALPWSHNTTGSIRLTATGTAGCHTWGMPWAKLWNILSGLNGFTGNIFNQYQPPSVQGDTKEQIKESMQWLGETVTNFFRQFLGMGNAIECIKSVVWVPWEPTSPTADVWLGEWDTGVTASVMEALLHTTVSIAIPWVKSDWRNASPYTQMYLYIPFIGVLTLNPSNFIGTSNINLQFGLQEATGVMSVKVAADTIDLGTYSADTGMSIPIGALTINPGSVVSSVIAAGAGMMAGGAGAALGIAGGAFNLLNNLVPNPSTIGGYSGGSMAALDDTIKLFIVYHDTSEAPGASAAEHGIPLMAKRTISSLSGYVQCEGASVALSGESTDRDAVNSFLNGGFFYE